MTTFLRPFLGPTAKTAVVARFEEALGEGLLAAWAADIRAEDGVTLVLLGARPESEMLAEAETAAHALGLARPGSADISISAYSPEDVGGAAAEADFLYSRGQPSGPLAGLPRVATPEAFRYERRRRRQRGVFVVGMHRSGTSAMARLVNLLGVPLSAPGDLFPARPDNPAGFWESGTAVTVSEELLRRLGGSVFAPPDPEPGWESLEALSALRWEARECLGDVLPTAEWVLKDPRSCLTLPFFRAVLDVDPVVVMPYRNPLAVADSLMVRDGIPRAQALALWERYVRSSLEVTASLPVAVHAFEDLMARPAAQVERLHGFLSDEGVLVRPFNAAMVRDVAASVNRDLSHHHHTAAEFLRVASPDQVATYERLVAADEGCAPATSLRAARSRLGRYALQS